MAIYLIQHGRSLPKEEDPSQGLSPEGSKEVALIAGVAANYGVTPEVIYHSGKKRSEETANILAEHCEVVTGVEQRTGLKPLDDVVAFTEDLKNDNAMYVSHLPFLEKLLSLLVTGTIDQRIVKFQNGGLLCLDQEETASWYIKWMLMPNIS